MRETLSVSALHTISLLLSIYLVYRLRMLGLLTQSTRTSSAHLLMIDDDRTTSQWQCQWPVSTQTPDHCTPTREELCQVLQCCWVNTVPDFSEMLPWSCSLVRSCAARYCSQYCCSGGGHRHSAVQGCGQERGAASSRG